MGAQAVRLSNVDINNALENKDFEVLFQPIFDLENGALARMETFVRWRHPALGVLPPGAFISFFESQGRMSELTRYVLGVALDEYIAWRGPYAPGFSINLALTDLSDEAFAPHLIKALRDREFPADLITLECPMPPVDADMDALSSTLACLRDSGVRLAIEVRGRANDFLRNIDPFPFDEIKTGGSAILRFARTVRGPGLSAISDLLDIANEAKAVITAVGVEDQASLAALKGLGFTAAQGNHLAKVGALNDFRPGRVNEVRALLDLAPLSSDDVSALFRTEAPAPKAAGDNADAPARAPADALDDAAPAVDAEQEPLIPTAAEQKAGAPQETPEKASEKTPENAAKTAPVTAPLTGSADAAAAAEKKAIAERAKKKARAIALAKRAKARDARKAAAIKRAKAKAAAERKAAAAEPPAAAPVDSIGFDPEFDFAAPAEHAPQAMQQRIAKEFVGARNAPPPRIDEKPVDARPTEDASTGAATTPAAETENAELKTKDPDKPAPAGSPVVDPVVAPAPSTPERVGALQMQLPIGKAAAHFRPGIVVGGAPRTVETTPLGPAPELRDAPPLQSKPAATQPQALDDPSFAQPVPTTPAAHPAPEPTPENAAEAKGSLFTEDQAPAAPAKEAAPRRKTKKNFLTRKYKVVPNHFWPRAWRRKRRGNPAPSMASESASTDPATSLRAQQAD